MKFVSATEAPAAIGPYSQAIIAGGFIFISGQLPMDTKTMQIISDDFKDQTEQVMTNIENILKSQGLGMSNIVKATVFLNDMNNFQDMNQIYEKRLNGHKPARAAIEVSRLPKDALIEIEVIASMTA